MAKSFLVHVNMLVDHYKAHAIDIYTTANQADLTALLLSLDRSPTVDSFTVRSTIVVPKLTVVKNLTESDLGIDLKLEKLK